MGLFNRGFKMAIRYSDEVISIDMYNSLVSGLNITTPSYDFTDPKYNIPSNLLTALDTLPEKVFDDMSIDELTECKLNGNGVYDKLITTARIHLKEEMDKGRITGAEYTNAYTQIVVSSMQQSVAFVTQMHQLKQSSIVNYYKTLIEMVQAKISAVTSFIQLEIQKANTQVSIAQANAQVATIKAQFAHTVAQLGQVDASYGLTQQQIELTHEQAAVAQQQVDLTHQQAAVAQQEVNLTSQKADLTHQQAAVAQQQIELTQQQTAVAQQQVELTKQQTAVAQQQVGLTKQEVDLTSQKVGLTQQQVELTRQQVDVAHQQVDLTHQQVDLTRQQITSFVRKDQRSAAQFWADNWTVQKGIDEGLSAPATFQNSNIQTVMAAVQKSHDLG